VTNQLELRQIIVECRDAHSYHPCVLCLTNEASAV